MIKVSSAERAALCAKSGSRQVKFRFDRVLQNGAVSGTVDATGSITMDISNQIMRTARFTVHNPGSLNWLSDMIKPYMLVYTGELEYPISRELSWSMIDQSTSTWAENDAAGRTWDSIDAIRFNEGVPYPRWAEWPLGLFVLSTPTRNGDAWEVEAYDRTVVLKEDCLTENLYIPAGEGYLDAVEAVLIGGGITSIDIRNPSTATLPVGREFEVGTSRLEVANALLQEITYNNLYADADGRIVISKYVEPSGSQAGWTYQADALSVIYRETSSVLDSYEVPNVIVAICSNPDMAQELRSIYTNDNPASPLSTVSRGRKIVRVDTLDSVASQADLDAYVQRAAFEAGQIYEEIQFSTLLMPIHEYSDVLMIQHPEISGVYQETGWSMDLEGGQMTHNCRRLVTL